jgi:hypothetical protein
MYTKTDNVDKEFYAFCRGIFPIQELCGTMTALALAQRDVLGFNMPLWKMLLPAVVIHGMANFRGMKVSIPYLITWFGVFGAAFAHTISSFVYS